MVAASGDAAMLPPSRPRVRTRRGRIVFARLLLCTVGATPSPELVWGGGISLTALGGVGLGLRWTQKEPCFTHPTDCDALAGESALLRPRDTRFSDVQVVGGEGEAMRLPKNAAEGDSVAFRVADASNFSPETLRKLGLAGDAAKDAARGQGLRGTLVAGARTLATGLGVATAATFGALTSAFTLVTWSDRYEHSVEADGWTFGRVTGQARVEAEGELAGHRVRFLSDLDPEVLNSGDIVPAFANWLVIGEGEPQPLAEPLLLGQLDGETGHFIDVAGPKRVVLTGNTDPLAPAAAPRQPWLPAPSYTYYDERSGQVVEVHRIPQGEGYTTVIIRRAPVGKEAQTLARSGPGSDVLTTVGAPVGSGGFDGGFEVRASGSTATTVTIMLGTGEVEDARTVAEFLRRNTEKIRVSRDGVTHLVVRAGDTPTARWTLPVVEGRLTGVAIVDYALHDGGVSIGGRDVILSPVQEAMLALAAQHPPGAHISRSDIREAVGKQVGVHRFRRELDDLNRIFNMELVVPTGDGYAMPERDVHAWQKGPNHLVRGPLALNTRTKTLWVLGRPIALSENQLAFIRRLWDSWIVETHHMTMAGIRRKLANAFGDWALAPAIFLHNEGQTALTLHPDASVTLGPWRIVATGTPAYQLQYDGEVVAPLGQTGAFLLSRLMQQPGRSRPSAELHLSTALHDETIVHQAFAAGVTTEWQNALNPDTAVATRLSQIRKRIVDPKHRVAFEATFRTRHNEGYVAHLPFHGPPTDMTPRARRLLNALRPRRGEVVWREQLRAETGLTDYSLSSAVQELRKALGTDIVRTHYGEGFSYNPQARSVVANTKHEVPPRPAPNVPWDGLLTTSDPLRVMTVASELRNRPSRLQLERTEEEAMAIGDSFVIHVTRDGKLTVVPRVP